MMSIPAPSRPMIQLSQVCKSFDGGATYAVDSVSLSADSGEFVVLLGESGCGKTTTLKLINRLIEPTSGIVAIDGKETAGLDPVSLRRSIGYVFQGVGLFPHMTVAENVGAVPQLLGWETDKTDARVADLLGMMSLPPSEYAGRYPAVLSGGQRQRVGVARALAARPSVVLMDEPFGALDPITRDNLQTEFLQLQRRLEFTVLMVTHDMTEAIILADRIAVMRDACIVQIGTPHELLTNPATDYVAQLLETPKRQADIVERLSQEGGER